MRPEIVDKRLNSIPELSSQGKKINGLFRLLACPVIWERAYEAIASNKGALTPGTDPTNTLDGFSLERVERIINRVMSGTYRFSPARRRHIPKPNGKTRPLGIPTADDKLVQSAVKLILERIYEPIFSNNSYGFRRGRSCHTALKQIGRTWTGTKWLIEVDIVSFFDNVDHDILLELLSRQIDDERLLRLIRQMLEAGYMEDWTYHETFSGTPQGGVISPILANIYLHELDKFMDEMKDRYDKGTKRRTNPIYESLSREISYRRLRVTRRQTKGNLEEVPQLLTEIRELKQQRRQVECSDWFDPDYRRLRYCRYADDFLIGIIGSKEEARSIMQEIREFLTFKLKLQVSEEKSGIRKASEGAAFLGYTVRTHGSYCTTRTINGRTNTVKTSGHMQLHASRDKLSKFVERKRLGNYQVNQGAMRPELTNNSDLAILAGYNAIMRGLAEYYKIGTSWRQEIGRVRHIWWWSLMKTLARKHKCSVAKIAQRLRNGEQMGMWYETAKGQPRFMAVFRLKDIRETSINYYADRYPQELRYFMNRTDITDRLKARTCEACGADDQPVEVHHTRRLADMKGTTLETYVKAARTRKRVVLCRVCHTAHHAGRLRARLDKMGVNIGAG